mgnify:CR=1 FL=1
MEVHKAKLFYTCLMNWIIHVLSNSEFDKLNDAWYLTPNRHGPETSLMSNSELDMDPETRLMANSELYMDPEICLMSNSELDIP